MSSCMNSQKPMMVRMPIGMFTQNTQAQSYRCTMIPPATGPMIAAIAQTEESQPWIFNRSRGA